MPRRYQEASRDMFRLREKRRRMLEFQPLVAISETATTIVLHPRRLPGPVMRVGRVEHLGETRNALADGALGDV